MLLLDQHFFDDNRNNFNNHIDQHFFDNFNDHDRYAVRLQSSDLLPNDTGRMHLHRLQAAKLDGLDAELRTDEQHDDYCRANNDGRRSDHHA